MKRLFLAIKAFWVVLTGSDAISNAQPAPVAEPEPSKPIVPLPSDPTKFNNGAVYAMALLQRESRLIDFLLEDVSQFADEQIGTAVRQIHKDCQKILKETFKITPIRDNNEGESITIEDDYDPAMVSLTGNVPDAPPYHGTLRHKGWQVTEFNFPTRTGTGNPNVIQQAEIEIS